MFRRRGRKASFAAAVLGVVLAATLVIAPSASASIYGTTVNKYGTWMHETPFVYSALVGHANPGDDIQDLCFTVSDGHVWDLTVNRTGLAGDHWGYTVSWISEEDIPTAPQTDDCDLSWQHGAVTAVDDVQAHSAAVADSPVVARFPYQVIIYVYETTWNDNRLWALCELGGHHMGWIDINNLTFTS